MNIIFGYIDNTKVVLSVDDDGLVNFGSRIIYMDDTTGEVAISLERINAPAIAIVRTALAMLSEAIIDSNIDLYFTVSNSRQERLFSKLFSFIALNDEKVFVVKCKGHCND